MRFYGVSGLLAFGGQLLCAGALKPRKKHMRLAKNHVFLAFLLAPVFQNLRFYVCVRSATSKNACKIAFRNGKSAKTRRKTAIPNGKSLKTRRKNTPQPLDVSKHVVKASPQVL